MQRVVPVLGVADLARAQRFYTESLGFTTDWVWQEDGSPRVFAQLSRGGLSLYLTRDAAAAPPGGGNVYLYVDDVDAWHRELAGRDVALESAPVTQPWGNREFAVCDLDGNQLTIATPQLATPRSDAN